MWWLHEGAGLGTNAIARHFSLDPAGVSRVIAHARHDRSGDLEVWKEQLRALDARKGPVQVK